MAFRPLQDFPTSFGNLQDDMNRLFAASKFGRPCTRIQAEAERVNLFAECQKS